MIFNLYKNRLVVLLGSKFEFTNSFIRIDKQLIKSNFAFISGHFDWINVPAKEKKRLIKDCGETADICPTYSPTMAGGLFAISRGYFWDIGSYDEQMVLMRSATFFGSWIPNKVSVADPVGTR